MEIDPQVDERLRTERIIWLTTTRPDGQPQASPIWFLWDGRSFVTYSLAATPRIRNIEGNPRVALNLSDDGIGGRIVTLEGTASIERAAPPPNEDAGYIAKYRDLIEDSGSTSEAFAKEYPVAIRIVPTRIRAW
jgi:PPOX class probable F420-dependent enzyme